MQRVPIVEVSAQRQMRRRVFRLCVSDSEGIRAFSDCALLLRHPVGRSTSPTFGHFKFPHPEGRVTEQ